MMGDAMFYDKMAERYEKSGVHYKYYRQQLARLFQFLVPKDASILEIGSGTGDLLAALTPTNGIGIDISPEMVEFARKRHPSLTFKVADATTGKFDYVVMSDLIDSQQDALTTLKSAGQCMKSDSRIAITYYNNLWQPFVHLVEVLRLKDRAPRHNWLSPSDIENLLRLAGFEVISTGRRLLLPINIPLISWFLNKYCAELPLLHRLCFVNYAVARLSPSQMQKTPSVTVVVPTWNEAGTIESAVQRMPSMGSKTEIIFVDNHSTDGTTENIKAVMRKYPAKDIKLIMQLPRKGKATAVYQGFDAATGDILMILDSDLTVPPEDLPKFYDALVSGAGEFINGSRLVYPMERQSMRVLNYVANKCFSVAFSWLLNQHVKDTLCGTKVLWSRDYKKIKAGRSYFGNFDPFGDFDLLFGAAKLHLRIVDMPIRYRERTYGDTKISRFRHGMILIGMCLFAARKLKFW